jgi:hypothetical protein
MTSETYDLLRQYADGLRDCLSDIYDLHRKGEVIYVGMLREPVHCCAECGNSWPCRTARMVASVR